MKSPVLVVALLLLAIPAVAPAQESPPVDHPLFELLTVVPLPSGPDEADDVRFLSYLDMRASERAAEVVAPANWQAFERLGGDERARWLSALQRWFLLTDGFPSTFASLGDETRELVGFDPFAVDRMVAFGEPPEQGQVLQGRFDPAAIVASFAARGHVIVEVNGLDATLLRRGDGEDDMKLDLAGRNMADPFGGRLGRREPLAVLSDTLLANSPSWERILALARTAEKARPSLLSDETHRAAVEALVLSEAAPELLVGAVFLSPAEFVGALELLPLSPDLTPEQGARIAAEMLGGELPPYELAVLADGHDRGEQLALIALVYPSAARAEAARPVLEERVAALSGRPTDGREETFVALVGGRPAQTVLYPTPTRTVLVVGVRYPVPTAEAGGRPPVLGGLYLRWMRALLQRSFLPLFL